MPKGETLELRWRPQRHQVQERIDEHPPRRDAGEPDM